MPGTIHDDPACGAILHRDMAYHPSASFPTPPLTVVHWFSDGTPFILDARGRLVAAPKCGCRR